ncbi:nicotinamide mononucleotide transporter [Arachidicoccus rhizosphaerae]|uniref:Nicotinamide riboside transporter PnuC n=1 Tax=Arachidicoccus rhizosphaerae TaxID=551991 RepID=A0A1H4AGC7_9BACT|nr:nicotinamide riboside transporter PnuC [Arachidicoccus rhizosphaerae]SEA34582.1 nicotinamide mononucleotide transporter [Arachidicoccus rhizosphaerae]
MDLFQWIEYTSVAFGLLYVIFIIRQHILCWICGIIGSALYICSCIHAKIYLEAGLNFYYVIMGFYGWYHWIHAKKQLPGQPSTQKAELPVSTWPRKSHLINIVICLICIAILGRISQHLTDSPRPYFDAVITVFSFSATYMEARKVLSAWVYWFFINGASIILMLDRSMPGYAILSAVTTLLCIKGYMDWKKSYTKLSNPDKVLRS